MAVHKSDRAAVKKLVTQNKRLAAKKARLMKSAIKLKSKAQVVLDQVAGLYVSADEIDRQIESNNAVLRGYSFGG